MIIRKGQAPADPEAERRAEHYGASVRLRYSDAGGLTQFGAHVETLQPGSRSSERHWHEEEDEFLYMLSGEATVIEEDSAHVLHPSDAACWPAGAANAHQVVNRSDTPCTYLIFGTRMAHEVIHYPDVEKVGYIEGETWRLHRTDDGALIMEGKTEQVRPLTWWGSEANRVP
jgi:uncharacterized cupin superfamily protein